MAMGLWVQAGSWSALNETNGFIPEDITEEFAPVTFVSSVTETDGVDVREALCDVGLWDKTDDGYQFEGWAEYQPTKEGAEEKRANDAERKRRSRAKKKDVTEVSGVTEADANDVTARPPLPSRPDPARPDPLTPNGVSGEAAQSRPARKRATRLPDDWMPDRDVIEAMRTECPYVDLEAEHRKFCDYWAAQPGQKGVKADWNATWRNWIRRAGENAPARPSGRPAAARSWFDLATTPPAGAQAVLEANVIEIGETQ